MYRKSLNSDDVIRPVRLCNLYRIFAKQRNPTLSKLEKLRKIIVIFNMQKRA